MCGFAGHLVPGLDPDRLAAPRLCRCAGIEPGGPARGGGPAPAIGRRAGWRGGGVWGLHLLVGASHRHLHPLDARLGSLLICRWPYLPPMLSGAGQRKSAKALLRSLSCSAVAFGMQGASPYKDCSALLHIGSRRASDGLANAPF